jgi:hypothetical protein
LKNSKIIYPLLFLLWILPGLIWCQNNYVLVPASFSEKSISSLYPVTLFLHDLPDDINENKDVLPLVAGHTILIDKEVQDQGIWDRTGKGVFIYRISFQVADAVGLNIYFRHLSLNTTDQLFIYNQDYSQLLGPYTATENAEQFAVGFLKGSQLIIELNAKHAYQQLPFTIAEIGVASALPNVTDRDYGDAGNCEVPVNCAEGQNWQLEKDGVARVLVKEGTKLFWCTGSLLNNTKNDGTPYFLTANHCGKNATTYDYGGWIFYFNYEVDGCEKPIFEPDFNNNLIGARLLAHSELDVDMAADFKLLLLNEEIPEDFRVYYNGWDRSGSVSPSGVTIHHPQGDVKMISTYDEPLVSVNYYNPTPNEDGRFWMVNWTRTDNGHGVTEGGSSGCPLFSSDGYLLGALTGGNASCVRPNEPDYYGKFSYAWDAEGEDSTRQLKYWLDPDNTGVLSLKGTNLDSTKVTANFSSDVTEVSIGERVQFYNHSMGNIVAYEWEFEGGDPVYSESENPPSIQYNTFGSYRVKLVARSTVGADSLIRADYIRVLPTLSPNPSLSGIYKLSFGKELPDNVVVEVYDLTGRMISPVFLEFKNDGLYVDISTHAKGMYLMYVKTEDRQQIIKVSYLNKPE